MGAADRGLDRLARILLRGVDGDLGSVRAGEGELRVVDVAGSTPSGMRAAKRSSTSMYSPKLPSTEYPPFCCSGHRVSQPVRQYSQTPQALQSHALPTVSPTARVVTSSPIATTVP